MQEIYISGALDAVSTISVPAQVTTAKFYNDCVVKKQIKAHDIVEDMKVILRSRPELYPPAGYGCTIAGTDKVWGTPILSELGDTLRAGSAQKKDRRKAVLLFSFVVNSKRRRSHQTKLTENPVHFVAAHESVVVLIPISPMLAVLDLDLRLL